jgi:hypothetical protein
VAPVVPPVAPVVPPVAPVVPPVAPIAPPVPVGGETGALPHADTSAIADTHRQEIAAWFVDLWNIAKPLGVQVRRGPVCDSGRGSRRVRLLRRWYTEESH